MKLFMWLLQRVAEMVRNLILIVSWPTLRQSSLRIFRRVRAFSYEPGNRAGSVTETNFVVHSYEKFQPGRPGGNPGKTTKMVNHKFVFFATSS